MLVMVMTFAFVVAPMNAAVDAAHLPDVSQSDCSDVEASEEDPADEPRMKVMSTVCITVADATYTCWMAVISAGPLVHQHITSVLSVCRMSQRTSALTACIGRPAPRPSTPVCNAQSPLRGR